MASRFALYQNSIKKFISNKSVISEHQFKDKLLKMTEHSDFILPIVLLTIMNGQQKKNQLKLVHGYDMSVGIELMIVLSELLKQGKKNSTEIANAEEFNIDSMYISIVSLIHLSFSHNVDIISQQHSAEEITKILNLGTDQINKKINDIMASTILTKLPKSQKKIVKTDLKKFHFKRNYELEQFQKINILTKEFIIKYASETYGSVAKLSLILGWILGGSPCEMINNLDRLGYHLGLMMKIVDDLTHLNEDMEIGLVEHQTMNYAINFGLQDAFELFDESKIKFIEGLLTLDINSPTIKEFIDILDKKVNKVLDQSSPDIHRTSSTSIQ